MQALTFARTSRGNRRTIRGIAQAAAAAGAVTFLGLSAARDVARCEAAPWSDEGLEKELDRMYDDPSVKEIELYTFAFSQLGSRSQMPTGLRWRYARACRDAATCLPASDPKYKSLIDTGIAQTRAAIEEDPDNWAAHKWHGIMLSRWSETEGMKEKIKRSYDVKHHFEKAVELNPHDPTSRHLLGRWCFSVAQVSWIERRIAATLFAAPPNSTYEEALEHFLQAEATEPKFWIKNTAMIAECYDKLGKKEEAKKWYAEATGLPANTEEDRQTLAAATKRAEALGI